MFWVLQNARSKVFSYDEHADVMVSCNKSDPTNSSTITIMANDTTLTLDFTLDADNKTMLEIVTLEYSLEYIS